MIHTKKIQIPAIEKEIKDYTTCDLCKNRIGRDFGYEETDITIKQEIRSGTPDGGESVTTEIDMCNSCFENKLIPWLASQGAMPRITRSEW